MLRRAFSTGKYVMERSAYVQGRRTLNTASVVSDTSTSGVASTAEDVDRLQSLPGKAKPFSAIPGPRGYLPYIGTLLDYRLGPYGDTGFHHALWDRYKTYGLIWKEMFLGQSIVHLLDPEMCRIVVQAEGRSPYAPPLLSHAQKYRMDNEISLGLGNSNGSEWNRLRGALRRLMSVPRAARPYLPHTYVIMQDFMKRLEKIRDPSTGEIPEFFHEIRAWNFESSAFIALHKRLGCLEDPLNNVAYRTLGDANTLLLDTSRKLRFVFPFHNIFPTKLRKDILRSESTAIGYAGRLVNEAIEDIMALARDDKLTENDYPFLVNLLNKDLSRSDIVVLTHSMLVDGLTTTANNLMGQLYLLATNEEKQEKAYQEIKKLMPRDSSVSKETIEQFHYLKNCIMEGFRFFPIGIETSRIIQKDLLVGGYHLPAGTLVEMNQNIRLRDPDVFPDPETYLPERWVKGHPQEAKGLHPYMMHPFSIGSRNCVGKRFAQQDQIVFLSSILRKYRVEWASDRKLGQKYNIIMFPDIDPKFRFIPRN